MRVAVYCDYPYRQQDGRLSAQQPVALFLDRLAERFDRLTLAGRIDPTSGDFPYTITNAHFVGLPHYDKGADPLALIRAMPLAAIRFWRLLGRVDVAWILGPTPLSLLFALLTLLRRRRLVLGVRQDLPELFRHRYPDRHLLRLGAGVLERAFRALGHRASVVVVGARLAEDYARARKLHVAYISLLREEDIAPVEAADRDYSAPTLRMLSVGRMDPEKNPVLLADVLAQSVSLDPRWRLDVCGDGPAKKDLIKRLAALGVADRATFHGHVPIDGGLLTLYRASHALIHVSHTEGVPQVLFEAFAMRLPVVATAVGGVPGLVGNCGLLIPPDDAEAAANALGQLISQPARRLNLANCGAELARAHTLETECDRLTSFLLKANV